uniref:Solute carrier family 22 member 31 n=1 Tax=Callorhinchus milii TaxID=7868 RepID=A0A4W3JCZ4_CALMI
ISFFRLGRRTTFILSLVLAIMLGVGVAVSLNFLMFIILQVFSGAALAGLLLSVYIARLEMCDPPHRLMITMIAGFFTVAGKLLLPGVTELCKDWRILQGVVTAPFLLLLIYWCVPAVFPESPRWLLATKQMEKCKQIIRRIAVGNGVDLEDELYASCNVLNGMFIAGGIQHCFVQNLVGYDLSFYFSYFIIVGTEGVACLFLYFTVNKCGRRGILLLTTIITGLSSLLLLALMQYLHHSLVLALSILGLCSSYAVAILSVFFASEVIPTVVRGAGLGLILAIGCIGKATTPITDLHNKHGFFLHHVIFASFAVLSVLCVMLLPESKRKPLPESIKDGENQRRPPLFLPRKKDGVPLLPSKHSNPALNLFLL